jgi:hypothetical protein
MDGFLMVDMKCFALCNRPERFPDLAVYPGVRVCIVLTNACRTQCAGPSQQALQCRVFALRLPPPVATNASANRALDTGNKVILELPAS